MRCDTLRERVASYLLLQWAICAYVRAWGEAYTRDAQWRRRRFIRQRISLPAAPERRSPARWRALACRRALIGPITHFLVDYNSVIMHFIAKWKTYVVLTISRSIWLRRVPGTFSEHPVLFHYDNNLISFALLSKIQLNKIYKYNSFHQNKMNHSSFYHCYRSNEISIFFLKFLRYSCVIFLD